MEQKQPFLNRMMEKIKPKRFRHDIKPSERLALFTEEQGRLNDALIRLARGCRTSNVIYTKTEMQRLLNAGANVNAKDKYGKTPLIWVAGIGLTDICALLVENGADVKARDNNGTTAAISAAQFGLGYIKTVKFLESMEKA